jgi:hypothetical protein
MLGDELRRQSVDIGETYSLKISIRVSMDTTEWIIIQQTIKKPKIEYNPFSCEIRQVTSCLPRNETVYHVS